MENYYPIEVTRSSEDDAMERERVGQLAILIGTLGLMLVLIGLFPTITGLEPKSGIGVLQILVACIGLTLLIIGALLFSKITFYPHQPTNLAQQIGVRLSLTGLLMTGAAGLADVLGFGSHAPDSANQIVPVLGKWQAFGMIVGFMVASLGVIVFTWMGPSSTDDPASN
ncbi:MAG: hypothetical protein BroJett018_12730 [Chloroflexota bacterium]|nr:hypothetical protein [Chloroflexota bacterium]NOG62821.1 hypothetical protein [Chloroflexota bacterium]GIK63479.1 MAG: hypothetical protein BroJett018_12730 [Chloroflexota bacterium]